MQIEAITQITLEAGKVVLSYGGRSLDTRSKADDSPVTAADLEADQLIQKRLRELDPTIPIISEETPIAPYEEREHWPRFWLIDPIDGTKEFVAGRDEYTVNIALVENGVPILGAVMAPARDVLYFGSKTEGTWRQRGSTGKPERVYSHQADRSRPLKLVESRSHGHERITEMVKGLNIAERIRIGSSIKFCLLADGTSDLFVRSTGSHEWDNAAGDAVFRYSAPEGIRESCLKYNQPDLKHGEFLLGF